MGYIVLQGGSEFSGRMQSSDEQALALAGGLDTQVGIIPAAAAPDANHERAGQNGVDWFNSLGARHVNVLPIIDHASANATKNVDQLKHTRLIYLLGGFPEHLLQTLLNSAAWTVIQEIIDSGGIITGSSAGAMVLCEHLFKPTQKKMIAGLNLIPNCCVIPHHNRFGKQWGTMLQMQLPSVTLIGIDEETGAINDGPNHQWKVYGDGGITLYRHQQTEQYAAGDQFSI